MNVKNVRVSTILFVLLFAFSMVLTACKNDNVRFSDTSADVTADKSTNPGGEYAPQAKVATYDVLHDRGIIKSFQVDIAQLNGFKRNRSVVWRLLNQQGTSAVVRPGGKNEKDFMIAETQADGHGLTVANYSVTTNNQTTYGQIRFNIICNGCDPVPPPPAALFAVSTDLSVSHEYNRTNTNVVDLKALSGVGSDSSVVVSILRVTGTLNGGRAEVISNNISYTTGLLQASTEDVVIEYQLQRDAVTSTASVRVDVTCVPDCIAPRGESVSANIIVPTAGPVAVNVPVVIDGGTITVTQQPTKGTLTVQGSAFQYTPFAAATGADTILYRVDKKLNDAVLASSATATVTLNIEQQNACVDICDGRPLSITVTFTPPNRNTDGTAIPEGSLASYNVFSEKTDTTEQVMVGTVVHTGPLSQSQSGKFNIDYARFSDFQSMSGICFRATAINNQGAESTPSTAACRNW